MAEKPKAAPSPGGSGAPADPRGVIVGVKPQPPTADTRDSAKMALQQSMDRRW